MQNFWALSAIVAAFCLGEVVSDNFGDPPHSQPGAAPQWGGTGGFDPTRPIGGGEGSVLSFNPMPQFGDDKIRIVGITLFFRLTFSS